MRPARVLTIAGSDSGGGAGIQADLKTFLGCGVHGMSAITAVTAQNTVGVTGIWPLPPEAVEAQIDAVLDDIGVDAVKIGMLGTEPVIGAVERALRRVDAPVVLDPVAVASSGAPLLDPPAVQALIALLPRATLVTPNLPEVRLLTGVEAHDEADLDDAARAVQALGPQAVLVKGGHLDGDAVDVLFDGRIMHRLTAPRHHPQYTHGTGCTLAAAIAAHLARGLDLVAAVRAGKAYVTAAIKDGYPVGAGVAPVGHFWRIRELALDLP